MLLFYLTLLYLSTFHLFCCFPLFFFFSDIELGSHICLSFFKLPVFEAGHTLNLFLMFQIHDYATTILSHNTQQKGTTLIAHRETKHDKTKENQSLM